MSEERAQEFVEENFGGGEEQVREGEEFGTENVREGEESAAENEFGGEEESFPVENDRGTTSEPSSSKRIKEMSIDRLSALPDSLLIHILSFLKMKEAAITSVLSKRWQFLWTELAWMIFWESSMESEKIRKFVAWVNRTLSVCSGNGLEGFVVEFQYQKSFASDVNVWVEFAVKNKVEELVLLLNSEEHYYTLPQMMYSNSSLTWLSLRGCIMTTPQRNIEWRSLTSLFLNEVVLRQHVIEKILSSCPVLRTLFLRECWGFNCLRVNSRSLHELAVEYTDGYSERSLEISAPYIRSLDILQDPEERKLRLTNIPSVVKACINFNGLEWDATEEEVLTYTRELFEYLLHVKELELGCRYMEVLPLLVVNGWQLPQSRRGCLTVNASRDEQSISCIVSLLESSPNLETLVINGYDPYEASITSDPDARRDLDCDLLHLKTVHIENFADPKIGGEPLLTLAQILLKRATILEKMVIDVDKTTFSSRHTSSDFTNIAQALLSYPKSSPKAVVLLR